MLPLPSASRKTRPSPYFTSNATHHHLSSSQQILATLRSRTRLTNLAAALLVLALSGSLLLNLNFIFFSSHSPRYSLGRSYSYVTGSGWNDLASPEQLESSIPLSIETTLERDSRYAELQHLIMVPGHAIWLGHDANRAGEDDGWILEPMQKGGSVKTYVKHIERGVEELKADPLSLLVFSGGATRHPPSPPIPESLSYYRLAMALSLIPSTSIADSPKTSPIPLNLRTATEEYALDSYQNLLFSIARFKEVTGNWPQKITVVGYGMKRMRFENLHRAALRFPPSAFHYIGIDDAGDTAPHYAGELKYGYLPFLASPSGCHPPLSIKRLLRNPYARYHPYFTSCPELAGLFEWCPAIQSIRADETWDGRMDEVGLGYPGRVPWDDKEEVTWDRERD
ncbi:cytoplasmic protein [Cryptococcus gattii E566]|uniref:Cytoplasm protein, putative n=2 Tax=Cryptococcus gattii TaxID=37769 RepID=E6R3R7_CRYGW|nr:cytoplasm protein, putative [Cryptococcus gattii WM276]ADV21719.1 cytoplasm protein, putative [Cryptococcus gattii WM276]KIR80638.1 cytoplasmic protein [Cryptococcus gattii EJB2]KIY35496.1 cytoplasmic protein [Cryptococcus gattii E566]